MRRRNDDHVDDQHHVHDYDDHVDDDHDDDNADDHDADIYHHNADDHDDYDHDHDEDLDVNAGEYHDEEHDYDHDDYECQRHHWKILICDKYTLDRQSPWLDCVFFFANFKDSTLPAY